LEVLSKLAASCSNLSLIVEGQACQGMSYFNPIIKYSGNQLRSLHLNIIWWPCGR